jgi:agmatinase
LFGLPFSPETAEVVVIPLPWEVTVSYGGGTALGPRSVLDASPQIDYFLEDIPEAWKIGVAMTRISGDWAERSAALRREVKGYLKWLESDPPPGPLPEAHRGLLMEVEAASMERDDWLFDQAGRYLDAGQCVGVLGGDHSSPLGLMRALAARHEAFGILQIDAHADLRDAYEGFRYSHASIMSNALELPAVVRQVVVGLRDYSEEESRRIRTSKGRIRAFTDQTLREGRFAGESWLDQVKGILDCLPEKVYISFDIDGLDPKLCPHTGTPVPGGLEQEEAFYLVKEVVRSGRQIIGFDLCEVAPGADQWDGNVGARVLYRLATWAGHQRLQARKG